MSAKALDRGIYFFLNPASFKGGLLDPLRRLALQKLFSAFPDGWPGFGLLILRLAVALNVIVQSYSGLTDPGRTGLGTYAFALASSLVGIALVSGIATPVAGLAATAGSLVNAARLLFGGGLASQMVACHALDLAVMSLTLVFLGPGAFSLDARLFARREIIIPDGRRSGR